MLVIPPWVLFPSWLKRARDDHASRFPAFRGPQESHRCAVLVDHQYISGDQMRSEFVSIPARGDQSIVPGHLSLNQFYISSDDAIERTVEPKRLCQSLNNQFDETQVKLGDVAGSGLKSHLSSFVTNSMLHGDCLKSADEIKVLDASCLIKPPNEVNEPLRSTVLSFSDDPGLSPVTNTLPSAGPGVERQVAFHPSSRMCDFTEGK